MAKGELDEESTMNKGIVVVAALQAVCTSHSPLSVWAPKKNIYQCWRF